MPISGFDIDLCTPAAVPGAGVIEYVPVDEIDTLYAERSVTADTWNQQQALAVADWYMLPHAAGSASWTEEQQPSDQGDYYRLRVSALLPADTPSVRGELSRMKQHRYILKLTKNGAVLLLGTTDQPLRFESTFDSGADGGDTRGHRCTFSGVALRKSHGYVPVF